MSQQLIAAALSQPRPLDGQTSRSGYNFSTELASPDATHFVIRLSEYNNQPGIHFDVVKDVSGGRDEIIYEDVYSGNTVPVERITPLYISVPKGADSNFTVEFYQVR